MGKNAYLGDRVSLTLSPELVEQYRRLAEAHGVPLATLLAIVLEAISQGATEAAALEVVYQADQARIGAQFADELRYQLRQRREKKGR